MLAIQLLGSIEGFVWEIIGAIFTEFSGLVLGPTSHAIEVRYYHLKKQHDPDLPPHIHPTCIP